MRWELCLLAGEGGKSHGKSCFMLRQHSSAGNPCGQRSELKGSPKSPTLHRASVEILAKDRDKGGGGQARLCP